MGVFAYLSILEALLSLAIVVALLFVGGDKLILYASMLMLVSIIVSVAYCGYTTKNFREVKVRWQWDVKTGRQLLSFASWSALGEMSWCGTLQGVNIVLNLFFGPAVNASRGIAYQVMGAVKKFVQSFQMAMNPQIVKQYAAGDVESMKNLVCRGTCFSFYLLLFLSFPILLRSEYILYLWLGEIPPYLIVFTRLVIINALLDTLSNLFATVVKAYGKIRNYQIVVSLLLVLNLPFSYLLLKVGLPPESTFWIYGLISITLLFVRLFFMRKMVGLSISVFTSKVLLPIVLTVLCSLPIPVICNTYISDTFMGFVSVSLLSCVFLGLGILFIGLTKSERSFIFSKVRAVYKRF